MKLLLLGAPRAAHLNRWKSDMAEAAELLGWDVTHLPARDVTTDDVIGQARGADLLIWARTHGHNPAGDIASMLRRVEDAGTVTVGLHLDLYWGVPRREVRIGVDPWWSCQWVFTADGGDRDWAGRGVNHVWCPPPMGHMYYGRGEPSRRYAHRAVFVGGLVKDIHGYHRAALLRWARFRYRAGFVQYGQGRRAIWGPHLSSLYASAGVVLGDSAPADCYWSDRMPITLGRGGLLAHPNTAGMAEQGFTRDVMVVYERGDFVGLGRQLDRMTPQRRIELTDNALTMIGERHMWRHRMQMIADVTCGS